MNIIFGVTGHVGSSVAATLLEKSEKITVVTHDEKKVTEWEKRRAKTAVVNLFSRLKSRSFRRIFDSVDFDL